MKHLQMKKNTGRNCFPKYYHDMFRCCGMSNEEIAKSCGINLQRLTDLMYSKNTTMDVKEFKAIKTFVKKIEQEEINSGDCISYWPLPPGVKSKHGK